MTDREKVKHILQVLFGVPILIFALGMIYLDSAGYIDVEKFGYAFFGGVIVHFLQYFFRKAIKNGVGG